MQIMHYSYHDDIMTSPRAFGRCKNPSKSRRRSPRWPTDVTISHDCYAPPRQVKGSIDNALTAARQHRRFSKLTERSGYCGRLLGRKFLKSLYLDDARRRRKVNYTFLSTTVGKVLSGDHTFWATKHVRENQQTLFTAQYNVAVETGEIAGSIFTQTKSLDEPAATLMLNRIQSRHRAFEVGR